MKPLVIYHANCTDGFGAAYAAWKKFGDDAEYVPMHYNRDLTASVEGRDVYILDFSFQKHILREMAKSAKSVLMLDHHLSALKDFGWQDHKRVAYEDGSLKIVFDQNRSGALLAWEHFHPNQAVPRVIANIDDRDRWAFALANSEAVHAGLQAEKPWSFTQWDTAIADSEYPKLVINGNRVLKVFDQQIKDSMRHAVPCVINVKGKYWIGKAVNAGVHQSELGNRIAKDCGTFALMWWVNADGLIGCSLRSVGNVDVSVLASVFGGGGHKNSAGFTTDMKTLCKFVEFKEVANAAPL